MGNLRQPDDRSAKRVKQISNGCFQVDGKTSVKFGDDSTYPYCSCSEWRHNRLPCKHFCLIFANIPGWGWEKLSSLYRESPLLNLDYAVMGMSVNDKQPEGDASWSDTCIPDITADDDLQSSEDAGVTLPLPSRRKGKSKTLQIHCRTVLKEVISATYLIQQENALKELAQDIDSLYAKAKKMMPNDQGVPIGEVSRASETKRADPQKLTKTPLNTIPPPPQKHGARKHPASGRFGAKAEWQRKFLSVRNHSRESVHAKVSLKRKRKPSNESKKKIKKMKIQESNLSTTASVPLDCEAERGKTSTPAGREKKQKTSHEVKIQERNLSTTASVPLDCEAERGKTSTPAGREKQKTSHEVKATSQLPCNLGE